MAMTGKGRREGLHPDFLRCLDRLADLAKQRHGITVTMTSGFRTRAEQEYLYSGWVRRLPGFNLAARPGTSNHEARSDGFGYAADIDPDTAERPELLPLIDEAGLYLSVRWVSGKVREPWHVEPAWRHGGKRPAFLTPTPPVYPPTLLPEYADMYHHYKLHPAAVNTGEPVDWLVGPDGRKAACNSIGFMAQIRSDPSTYRFHDLSADKDASVWFRTAHP